MKLYRIKDWDKHYEISDTKKVDGPLSWIAVRTKTDGLGFARIAMQKDRSDLLSTWYLMLGIAAKQSRPERGKLSRDGIPMTVEDLALITRWPAQAFERAISFFSDPRQGWMVSEEVGVSPEASESVRTNPDASESVRTNPEVSAQGGPTGQDRTGQDKTVGSAAGASPAADSDWIEQIKADPTYHGIPVDLEYGKMRAWCAANKKQPSRRRVVNWLNRCERPINLNAPRPRPPAVREPDGWREFCESEFNGPVFLDPSSDQYAKTWDDLPRETQQLIRQRMNV